nr:MAG TPA: hypothetical protein [Crassvirales sp.]
MTILSKIIPIICAIFHMCFYNRKIFSNRFYLTN